MDLNPYAKFLAGADPLPIISTAPASMKRLLDRFTLTQLDAAPAPGKWSAREIIAHLADCEIAFGFRIRQALAHPPGGSEGALVQPFDQAAWAASYAAYDYTSAIAAFTTLRAWDLKLIRSLSTEDRARPTTHPERGTMTLWTIVETMAGHDLNHLQQLEGIAATHTPAGPQSEASPPNHL